MTNEDTWPKALTVGFMCFIFGFGVHMFMNVGPDFELTGFVVIIIFAIFIRIARSTMMAHELTMAQLAQAERKEELQLLKERAAAEQREIKLLNAANKVQKQSTQTTQSFVFTSNDFDDAAQGLLLGPIKAARKANAKVTGQGLIETFLKGLR